MKLLYNKNDPRDYFKVGDVIHHKGSGDTGTIENFRNCKEMWGKFRGILWCMGHGCKHANIIIQFKNLKGWHNTGCYCLSLPADKALWERIETEE